MDANIPDELTAPKASIAARATTLQQTLISAGMALSRGRIDCFRRLPNVRMTGSVGSVLYRRPLFATGHQWSRQRLRLIIVGGRSVVGRGGLNKQRLLAVKWIMGARENAEHENNKWSVIVIQAPVVFCSRLIWSSTDAICVIRAYVHLPYVLHTII